MVLEGGADGLADGLAEVVAGPVGLGLLEVAGADRDPCPEVATVQPANRAATVMPARTRAPASRRR
jgi:hypothetical protein